MSNEKKYYDPSENEPLPEGEEAPPPLTHTMAIVRWVILIMMSFFAFYMILTSIGISPWQARADNSVQYHCPMHPTYVSNQPGECPICGMTLVPVNDSAKAESKTADSAEQSTEPNKTMPVTGAANKRQADTSGSKSTSIRYVCPMGAEFVSDKPGKCPKCGMTLVPESGTSMAAPPETDSRLAQSDPQPDQDMSNMPGMDMPEKTPAEESVSAVPGLVPVTIEPERLQLIGVKTGFVERRSVGGKINIVGFVTPDETKMRNIHVRVNGWVLDLFVDKTGQLVEAGQPLVSIYSQDLYQAEQDYMVARDAAKGVSADSALASMRRQLLTAASERLRLLGLSETEIDELEKSEVPSTQMMLRSPFSGYVLEKSVLPGQYLSPDQNLFTIADLSKVWVLGDVYESDIPYIRAGQKVVMHLTAFPGEEFRGTISYIYPSVEEKTRTMKVRMEFENTSMRLRPGMYAEVAVDRGGKKTLVVPADAVLDGGNEQYAFVVHNGKHFEPRLLEIGETSDDWTEVLSGLTEGEEVVTSANFLIDSESRLKAAVAGMGAMPGMEGMDMPATQDPKENPR